MVVVYQFSPAEGFNALDVLFVVVFLALFVLVGRVISEGVKQDGQKEVQQNEIAQEDPRDVIDGAEGSIDRGHAETIVHQDGPALHGQYLEGCEEGRVEVVEVPQWHTSGAIEIFLKIKLPSENLHPQKGKNEKEQKQQKCKVNEGIH
jgi:hypothetical protein